MFSINAFYTISTCAYARTGSAEVSGNTVEAAFKASRGWSGVRTGPRARTAAQLTATGKTKANPGLSPSLSKSFLTGCL